MYVNVTMDTSYKMGFVSYNSLNLPLLYLVDPINWPPVSEKSARTPTSSKEEVSVDGVMFHVTRAPVQVQRPVRHVLDIGIC